MIRGKDKITRAHKERWAYVYVRQSSATQVRFNLESQQRQYELQDLMRSLGWPPESIVVLDEDLGHSADGTRGRSGFTRLREEVCQGTVGMIMSLETSRLARNNREWYQLLDICAVYGTLVAEPGGVYDPREYDDRLHLGLKGILSEAELHILKSRLVAGARHKAERGELALPLPVGLLADTEGKTVLDPDQNIQHTLRSIFQKFGELLSVRKVLRWMQANSVKIPRRIGKGVLSEVVWQAPTYAALLHLFHNPRYAGTYVFGRTETCMKIADGEPRRYSRKLPVEQWKVVMPGAHPGYLTWEEYLRNRERIGQNHVGKNGGRGATGRGQALLQGLLRCGRCATRMQVAYRTRHHQGQAGPTREAAYHCFRDCAQYLTRVCQRVSTSLLDHVVAEAFQAALAPAQLEVSLEALQQLDESTRAAERHWALKLERVRYEAERAKRQYDRVEPENRLVARDLERRWEECLQEVKSAEAEYARWQQSQQTAWGVAQIEELRELVKNVPALWQAETTKNEDRKELLRLLIEDVWVWTHRETREVELKILWKGGSQTVHRAAWWLSGRGVRAEVLQRIREHAAQGVRDTEIARRLQEEGFHRCDGKSYQQHNITCIRLKHQIPKMPRPHAPDVYNLRDAARKLGISQAILRQWIRDGLIPARQDRTREWRVQLSQEVVMRVMGGWDRECEWTVPQVAKFLEIPLDRVYTFLKMGRLRARRIKIGRQDRLLITSDQARQLKPQLCPGSPQLCGQHTHGGAG